MSARGCSLFVGLWLIGCLIGAARADEPSLVGDLIYPKSNDVPIRAGDRCGTYSITNRGRKSVIGYTAEAGANVLEASRNCWK